MNVHEIFLTLKSNASKNFKIEFLEKHKNNEDLKRAIFLALDPNTQFYIRKIPKYTPASLGIFPLKSGMELLSKLSNREVTGHAGIEHLLGILSCLESDDSKVIERIIDKDLDCGVAAATVNKVWEGFIPEWPCMTCEPYKDKFVKKIKYPAYVQDKEDGMRFNAIVKNGKVEFRSRNGKLISLEGSPIEADFMRFPDGVYDGELLVGLLDRKTGNGILNKAVKGTISDEEKIPVRAVIWDYIPYDDFMKGKCSLPYVDRLKACTVPKDTNNVSKIKTDVVETYEEAVALFQAALAQKKEGIILKDPTNLWENKRSQKQIKFKNELTCELRIKGVKEHTEKPGTLGAFECESEDGVIEVSVGSGISDAQRIEFWKMNLLDKIITVKYNERIKSKSKKGKESLFLPIFIELRLDKDVADKSSKIK
jgi:hypothetical protein